MVVFICGALTLPAFGQEPSVNVINDRPGARACQAPFGLPPDSPDVNNQPQAEVWIDVADDGRLAAAAKDFRFSSISDVSYNNRVWNGLYLSNDAGAHWRNLAFEDSTPDTGVTGVTDGAYGRPAGHSVRLSLESDPVVAFDRDGNIYTSGLAYEPGPATDPSAVVVSRRDPDGRLVASTLHLIGLEDDGLLFNDKNWLAVDRESAVESTIVVATWRLFTDRPDTLAPEGGYLAISGDGAQTFSAPIRLPVPADLAPLTQFYQPLLGRDPQTRRRVLYVILRSLTANAALAMHVAKADIDGASGTAALAARLQSPASWSFLASRLSGLSAFGASGYDGGFRLTSAFMPALDPDSGQLYAVLHAFDPVSRRAQVLVSRSLDGAVTWSAPAAIDPAPRGDQLMPSVAARNGRVYAVWYDSRNDPDAAPLTQIHAIDVYAGVLDDALRPLRVVRLTPESQRADRPVFTRPRDATPASRTDERPHDYDPREAKERAARATGTLDCVSERYGFIGDYIGIAANPDGAFAAWTDLRGLTEPSDVCAGHDCGGNRNQSVHAVRIPR